MLCYACLFLAEMYFVCVGRNIARQQEVKSLPLHNQLRVMLRQCLEATNTGRSGCLFCSLTASISLVCYGGTLLDQLDRVTTAREVVWIDRVRTRTISTSWKAS